MNLLELCEPLFLKVCELNRMGRLGQSQDYLQVRAEIKGLFEDISQRAAAEVKLAAQYRKVELPLVYFMDSMIASGKLKFAGQWHQNRLAHEKFNDLAGDDRFFDLLEETLNDSSDEASERLAVFYVCLGLGFVGALVGQPEQLKKYMGMIQPRVRPLMDVEFKSRLCPEAYIVDTTDLPRPQGSRMALVAVLFVFFVLSFLLAYYGMYRSASDKLTSSIKFIMTQEPRR